MNGVKPTTIAEMYDLALKYGRDKHLPPDYPRPRPTAEWPSENIAILEKYCKWLTDGGASPAVIRIIYMPMAGHILGLALKPYADLDLETDLQRGLEFLKAKQLSAQWTDNCRNAMLKFRRFLRNQRGIIETKVTPYNPKINAEGLPDWLITELEHYQHIQQCHWRTARLEIAIRNFWKAHLKIWRYLCDKYKVKELADIHRSYLHEYIDELLQKDYAIATINTEMRNFHSLMIFLQDQGYSVPQVLLHTYSLKEPDRLPKFLSDEQIRLVRDEIEANVLQAQDFRHRRDKLLIRAAFYLLWQSGMRVSEVEELRLEELDIEGRKLTVRQSKNLKDRTVYMTDTTIRALKEYLAVRGSGPTDHVFLYRNQPVSKDLIRPNLRDAGKRVGVHVYPHRLRHTAATQLLNAGCRITSIQKFLGHKELSTTMIYARVHDKTVSDDYYRAMDSIEKHLELLGKPKEKQATVSESGCKDLLAITDQLAEPELNLESRLVLVAQIRLLLMGEISGLSVPSINYFVNMQQEHPPPIPVIVE